MFDDPRDLDTRDRDDDWRERELDRDSRERSEDPRDVFIRDLDLPRGRDRELVLDRDRTYELNGEESHTLAAAGVFRVISERDVSRCDVKHLQDQGLIRLVSINARERGIVLTHRGRDLLEANRRDPDEEHQQTFYAGLHRARELTHDSHVYRAYVRAEERLREQEAQVRRVAIEQELKREYQCFLQEHNRDRADSDGRPDRDQQEVEEWARDHDLPYFDDQVHFPDFRIEYELDGRDCHEDIEVLTEHYRGAHAAARGQSGFTCYRARGGGSGRGARSFDPRFAEEFL